MKQEDIAMRALNQGDDRPYDAPDAFWHTAKQQPPPPKDWAHRAARGVLVDLCDRKGVKQGFNHLSEDVRAQMVEELALIIRVARSDPPKEKENPPKVEANNDLITLLTLELQTCRAAITGLAQQLERQARRNWPL